MDRPERPFYPGSTVADSHRRCCWPPVAELVRSGLDKEYAGRCEEIRRLIVIGAAQYRGRPSSALRGRLDHAVEIWRRGFAPRMLLTVGTAEGDSASEAAVSHGYVSSRGIPDNALPLENEGRTSSQSPRAAADLLRARSLHRGCGQRSIPHAAA